MKFIITENQYERSINLMKTNFDTIFNIDDIMFGPSDDFDWDIGKDEMQDDKWDFYRMIKNQKDLVFTWYDGDEPTVIIHGGLGREMEEQFGEQWEPVFIDWFEDNFGKPVKNLKY